MKEFDKWQAEQLVLLCTQSVESRDLRDGNEWVYHYEEPERTVQRAVETFDLILKQCHVESTSDITRDCVCGHALADHYMPDNPITGCSKCGRGVCNKFREAKQPVEAPHLIDGEGWPGCSAGHHYSPKSERAFLLTRYGLCWLCQEILMQEDSVEETAD